MQENIALGEMYVTRVARSNIFALRTMGAQVLIAGPTMCPDHFEGMGVECVTTSTSLGFGGCGDDAVSSARTVGAAMLPSIEEYASLYGLNMECVQRCQSHCLFASRFNQPWCRDDARCFG